MSSASFLAHRELAFMNPMGEAATDAAIAALDLGADARVVETGCGSAEVLLRVLEAHPGATGIGVDPDRDGLEVAREQAASRVPGREPQLVVATAQEAELPEGAFDLVVNVAASHAHGGFPDALAELRALTRPGGQILLGEGYWTVEPSPEFLRALGDARADELPLGLDALRDAVRAAGLEVEATATASVADLAAYEEGLAAAAERLEGDDAAAPTRGASASAARCRVAGRRSGSRCSPSGVPEGAYARIPSSSRSTIASTSRRAPSGSAACATYIAASSSAPSSAWASGRTGCGAISPASTAGRQLAVGQAIP